MKFSPNSAVGGENELGEFTVEVQQMIRKDFCRSFIVNPDI